MLHARVLVALAVAALLSSACSAATFPLFASGYASPGRGVDMYLLDAAAAYGPTNLAGTIYVFRTTSSYTSTVVGDQREVITIGAGDVRQIVVVVVPTTELTTEAEVLASGYATVVLGQNTYGNTPVLPTGFSYQTALHSTKYPTRAAFFGNGTATSYIDFGLVTSTAAGAVYQQQNATGHLVGFLIDSAPGDTTLRPMPAVVSSASLPSES